MSLGSPDKLAGDLLAELGITSPEDIDVEVIAWHAGALVRYEPLSGCDGMIIGAGDRAVITVNSCAPRGRQRFTAAHEIGHWLYDRGKVEGACTEEKLAREWNNVGKEQRANRFAAHLLMPKSMLLSRIPDEALTLDVVRSFAAMFETSLMATALRLVESVKRPAMAICMASGRRQWFKRNELVPEGLWPVEHVAAKSYLARLERTAGVSAGGIVAADVWTSHRDADGHELHEDSVMITDGLSLTIISWPEEDQIIAFAESEDDVDE